MIITQTPLRIGLLGGGTDLPDYYREHGGRVLNCAIDKYIYVIVKQRFDNDIYVNYSKKEIVSRVEDLEHELVREAMWMTGVTNGVEITTLADIPSAGGSGLGSSSAVTVGLLHALFAYRGRQVTAEELADRACAIEIDRCGKPIGKQDQYIAAYGGIRDIRFGPGDQVLAEELELPAAARLDLQRHVMLFYTGITRSANSILAEQTANIKATRDQLDLLRDLAGLAADRLRCGDVDAVGEAMRKGWEAKRQLAAGVSNPRGRHGGRPRTRGRGDGRQADRRGRRRLPAGYLPDRTAARRAREPGRYAGTTGEARPARVADRAQRATRHLGLRNMKVCHAVAGTSYPRRQLSPPRTSPPLFGGGLDEQANRSPGPYRCVCSPREQGPGMKVIRTTRAIAQPSESGRACKWAGLWVRGSGEVIPVSATGG